MSVVLLAAALPAVASARFMWSGKLWIVQQPYLDHFRAQHPVAGRQMFDNGDTYVLLNSGDPRVPVRNAHVPSGWQAHGALAFESVNHYDHRCHHATNTGGLAGAIARGRIPSSVHAVIYDNEDWRYTAWCERRSLKAINAASWRFARLAHRHGLVYIGAGGSTRIRYLAMLAADARYADIVDIQAQHWESTARGYNGVLTDGINTAKAANPRVRIVAETTSNVEYVGRGAIDPTLRLLANRRRVDGFWPFVYPLNGRSESMGSLIWGKLWQLR